MEYIPQSHDDGGNGKKELENSPFVSLKAMLIRFSPSYAQCGYSLRRVMPKKPTSNPSSCSLATYRCACKTDPPFDRSMAVMTQGLFTPFRQSHLSGFT
jgi:hypothetical protein